MEDKILGLLFTVEIGVVRGGAFFSWVNFAPVFVGYLICYLSSDLISDLIDGGS